ncbi:hypothetical protein E5676_scaffold943G00140 [Cucumis melo var. makuwa]|uniref:Uncharacterized protein n=1 Tax=Cucumis melo var. makuwa TaxID=1194695 RepID=A0A5A7VC00_CUCMM|nr:hypothetical protein E6C27_scaffold37G001530 [Cucumis melo var. makuwa]TYK24051.1 hypothetical protein E5676_scaffold943G00140 [Cucumis melo var. makuwa]
MDRGVTISFNYGIVYLASTVSYGITTYYVSYEITRLICVSYGITRLTCVSYEITRSIWVSDGIPRLIRVPLNRKLTVIILNGTGKGNVRGRPTRSKKDS